MTKLLSLAVASVLALAAGSAFADDFSSTITDGSTISATRDVGCGGTTDTYNVQLPAGCVGTIDTGTGIITITSCTFSPSTQVPGFVITLSASSGSGSYDGTNLNLVPNIDVNVTDNPSMSVNCNSDASISPSLTGIVTGGSGSITLDSSISGPTFSPSASCPPVVAGTLTCLLNQITGATLNLTIP